MSQYQRLLLIADYDLPRSAAKRRAVALAHASGAAIHMLALVEPPTSNEVLGDNTNEQACALYLGSYRAWLQKTVESLQAVGLHVTGEALWTEDPLSDLLDYVDELKPDVLIKDTREESTLKRFFMTPFDWQFLRESPVPVHFVNQMGKSLPRVIVAAVDTSGAEERRLTFNRTIIDAAKDMALQCDAQLHLVYAYDLTPAFASDSSVSMVWAEELRIALLEPFTDLADLYGVADEYRHFDMGTPLKVISDLVNKLEVDVVVMGIVQPKGLGKRVGDTTERLLGESECSVLAINPTT